MYILAEPVIVRFTPDLMSVELDDGRIISVPIAFFPSLLHATPEQRAAVELSVAGLHWDELDEDISIAGLLAGSSYTSRAPQHAA